jgi:hypothetical protein
VLQLFDKVIVKAQHPEVLLDLLASLFLESDHGTNPPAARHGAK